MQKMSKRTATDLSMLTHVPLLPAWFARLPAFQSSNAQVVRGAINMLMAAFHGEQAGMIPKSIEAVATTAQLSIEVATEHLAVLVAGWTKGKDHYSFAPMVELARRLNQDHSEALQQLQDSTIVAMNAPDLFNSELLPAQGVALSGQVGESTRAKAVELGTTKVKRTLPEGAKLTPALIAHLVKEGFDHSVHDELWEMFADRQYSIRSTSASWTSEFKHWLRNQVRYSKVAPQTGDVPRVFKEVMEQTQNPSPRSTPSSKFSFSRPVQAAGYPSRAAQAEGNASQMLDAASAAVTAMRSRQAPGA